MSNNDMHISGSGTIAAGNYGGIRVNGSGKIRGSITCTGLYCSGSAKAEGDIVCSGEVKCSGSIHCNGKVEAELFSCSGSARTDSGIKAGTVKVSGSIRASDIEAECIVINGGCGVSGLMNAETIEINLNGGCTVGSIGCGKLTVKPGNGCGLVLFGIRKNNIFEADTIEGDEITLENTTADIVRGNNVIIGKNCNIKTVEYSQSLSVDPSSTVREQLKI